MTEYKFAIVSNRLPVKRDKDSFVKADGGLVTALDDAGVSDQALWFGHDGGDEFPEKPFHHLFPLSIDKKIHQLYYNGFCNSVIWPAFHNRFDLVRNEENYWSAYKAINHQFAKTIIENSDPSLPVWIHDYHLMLLPKILKEAQPERKVGFFLHIPWPRNSICKKMPHFEDIARSLLYADCLSFQTNLYKKNFLHSIKKHFELTDQNQISRIERKLHVTPVGIDATTLSSAPKKFALAKSTLKIIGVDRFDYSKGIDFKLLALHDFLEMNPHLRGLISFHQLLVPTRENINEYQRHRRDVLELAKYINRKFRQDNWDPIHLRIGRMTKPELIQFYQSGDICFVSSHADGMNLVAMEYLAAQDPSSPGLLLLSDKTGAAEYLQGALQFDGWSIESATKGLYEAHKMSEGEKKDRWEKDMQWIRNHSAHSFALQNLRELGVQIDKEEDVAISQGAFMQPHAQ